MKEPFTQPALVLAGWLMSPDIVGPHGGDSQVTRSRSRPRQPSRPAPDHAASVLGPVESPEIG
jgi:hypothetical protein